MRDIRDEEFIIPQELRPATRNTMMNDAKVGFEQPRTSADIRNLCLLIGVAGVLAIAMGLILSITLAPLFKF